MSRLPVRRGVLVRGALLLSLALALDGCATQVHGTVQSGAPGFFFGLLQGIIAPIAWVVSLFRADVSVYAVPNNGGWYNFGFLLGLSAWAGGGAAARR